MLFCCIQSCANSHQSVLLVFITQIITGKILFGNPVGFIRRFTVLFDNIDEILPGTTEGIVTCDVVVDVHVPNRHITSVSFIYIHFWFSYFSMSSVPPLALRTFGIGKCFLFALGASHVSRAEPIVQYVPRRSQAHIIVGAMIIVYKMSNYR